MSILVSQLLAYAETKTQAGTGTLNSAQGIGFLNEAQNEFRSALINKGIDASQIQESYADGAFATAGGDSYSTFAYPADMYALKTIEVNMTDNNPLNYIQAQQADAANLPGRSSFSWARANQPSSYPLFDDHGDTYEIYPSFKNASNTANAIRLVYYLNPIPYATTSDALQYPDVLNWQTLAERVSAIYYESLNKFTEAEYWNAAYQKDMEQMGVTLERGSKQPLKLQQLTITGWEF